jgi:hypothetical protein
VQRARLLHRRSSRLSPFHFGSGVVWLPSVVAVPVVEPRLSRKVTALPLRIAVPTVEPRESRGPAQWPWQEVRELLLTKPPLLTA